MRLGHTGAATRALGTATLLLLTGWASTAEEPTFVRRLALPVADDAIGYPRGVTADPHTGEVFVCDTRGNRILVFDSEGLFVYEIPGGDVFTAPRDVAVDPEGYLVTVAGHDQRQAILELDFDGLFIREVVLSGLPEDVAEPHVRSLALSTAGDRIYALDSRNNRLWITSRDGEVVKAVDLAGEYSTDAARDLILGHVDVYGDTVLVAIPSFSEVRAFDRDGQPTGSVSKPGTAPCTLAFPTAAALAEDGSLLIVDRQRMVVLRWSIETNRCLGEHLGIGASPGFLYYPMDLALDQSGQMYIAQGYEGRVQMYEGMTPATAPAAPR
jgi:hypothetical protein